MSEAFVLDASAVLCLLKGEKGTDRVIEVLPRSSISAVNLSEVYAKLADAGGSEEKVVHAIGVLHLKVEPFDAEQCRDAGMLRPATKSLGLSLGDRACLALARREKATAVTADQIWSQVPEVLNIAIECLR
jgi:ribonuclease VapC